MTMPFSLIWSQNGTLLHGGNADGSLVFPVMFSGVTSLVQQVTLNSSARVNGTFDILSGVKFYLAGDSADLAIIMGQWPNLGSAYTPARPELNGGLQISFDGTTWTTFCMGASGNVGNPNDPTTWLPLPAIAVGLGGADGILGPYDIASLSLRYLVPNSVANYQLFNISLAVDCDVV